MANKAGCKVSVIVPVYRVEKYIDRCIRSLIKQTLTNIEILCICEKEDTSYQKLLAYEQKDSRVTVIEKTNTGVSAARNAGIQAAKGKYIAFVDADDWIERYALKQLYNTAERYQAQIVAYGIWPTVEPSSDKRSIFDCTPTRNVIYRGNGIKALFYEHGSRPYVINKFYQTNFLRNNNIVFDESIDVGEDQLLQFLAFAKADSICFVKDKFYHYEISRKDSAMNINQKKQMLSEKNFHLLQIIMEQKNKRYGDKYNKEYLEWILQDYGWIVNQKTSCITKATKNKIMKIQGYLQNMSVDKYIGALPREYQALCERFLNYQGSQNADNYIRLPYREYNAYLSKQTVGIYQKIFVPEKCFKILQRLYEIIVFHEIQHWVITIPIRMVQRYKINKARRTCSL